MSWLFNPVGWSFAAAIFTGLAAGTGFWALWLRTADAKASAQRLALYQSEAKSQIAEANARAEEAKKGAETAKLEAERLKEKLAWRSLTDEQINKIGRILAVNPSSATLAYVSGDPEAQNFAMRISAAMAKGGWTVHPQARTMNNVQVFGLFLNGTEAPALTAMTAFRDGKVDFSTDTIPASGMFFGGGGPGSPLLIMVGSKRPQL